MLLELLRLDEGDFVKTSISPFSHFTSIDAFKLTVRFQNIFAVFYAAPIKDEFMLRLFYTPLPIGVQDAVREPVLHPAVVFP